jgi:hypothetical protein
VVERWSAQGVPTRAEDRMRAAVLGWTRAVAPASTKAAAMQGEASSLEAVKRLAAATRPG